MSVSRNNSVTKVYSSDERDAASKCEGGGNSTPAEDEGISSSDQDDSEEIVNTSREFTTFYNANDMNALNKYSSCQQDKHSEPTIDEVMEDFQKIINDVQNQNCRNEQTNKELEKSVTRQFKSMDITSNEESLYDILLSEEETDIVPSVILPEPPKKTRSLNLLNKNIETNPFFEDESVVDTGTPKPNSNCGSTFLYNFQSSSNGYSTYEHIYERGVTDDNPLPVVKSHLRRSETFHHLQSEKGNIGVSGTKRNYAPDSRIVQAKPRRCLMNDKLRMLNAKNKSYIAQNSNNVQKELVRNKEGRIKLSRSLSTKPLINGVAPTVNCAPFPRISPVSYFSKKNVFSANSSPPQFSLKRRQNAGLYSDTHHILSTGSNHLHQVITITSEYPKRSLNGLKQINLNVCDGKLMDLPSGLY